MLFRVTYNGQSLLLCWYFLMSSPEPLLIEKLKLKLYSFAEIYSESWKKS
jgi:hypothetical protein